MLFCGNIYLIDWLNLFGLEFVSDRQDYYDQG